MKPALKLLGCILQITGVVFFVIYFRVMILYTTDYLLFGSRELVRIEEKVWDSHDNEFKYLCTVLNPQYDQQTYISCKTSTNYLDNEIVYAMVSPTFKTVMFGRFVIGSYIIGLLILIFLITTTILLCKQSFLPKNQGYQTHIIF